MNSSEHDAANAPSLLPLNEGAISDVEASEQAEAVGSIPVDETIAIDGLSTAQHSPDRAQPFITPKTMPPVMHNAEKPTDRPLSKREQWIMDVVRDPKTFRDTVLGYYIRGDFGFDKLPRKEILRLFQRRSYKLLTPEVSDAIKQGLDDLVVDGVLIKKTYPNRTKKIRDTVYLHLSPTISDELHELAAIHTVLGSEVAPEVPTPVSYAWDEDQQNGEQTLDDSEESRDEEFEKMLGPFRGGPEFKPRNQGRREGKHRR